MRTLLAHQWHPVPFGWNADSDLSTRRLAGLIEQDICEDTCNALVRTRRIGQGHFRNGNRCHLRGKMVRMHHSATHARICTRAGFGKLDVSNYLATASLSTSTKARVHS